LPRPGAGSGYRPRGPPDREEDAVADHRAVRALVGAGLGLALLAGCSGADVPLTTRPTDLGSARDLARAVADAGHCGGLEDLDAGSGSWAFTCQDGGRSFTITAVDGDASRLRQAVALARSSAPVKAGEWFFVQEDLDFGAGKSGPPLPTPVGDLDRFPGSLVRTAG
jgi:hypothetical protein